MPRRLSRYQLLAVTTVLATLVLIAIGAIVRTTGSGLGCPDWPLCHGRPYPPLEKASIIEYSHRTAASIVGVLVLATALLTFWQRRGDRVLVWLAVASLPLIAFQAWIGKVTVERELPAPVVTFHLATALVLLAVLTLIAAFALLGRNRFEADEPGRRTLFRVALGGALVTYLVLLSGAYVVGENASAACRGWPGCPGAPIPFVDGVLEQHVHWLHRFAVLGGLAAVAVVARYTAQLSEADRALRRAGWLLVALYVGQILVGASNIWTDFSEGSRAAHLALGATIWALLVLITVGARYHAGSEAVRAPAGSARARSRQQGAARA